MSCSDMNHWSQCGEFRIRWDIERSGGNRASRPRMSPTPTHPPTPPRARVRLKADHGTPSRAHVPAVGHVDIWPLRGHGCS